MLLVLIQTIKLYDNSFIRIGHLTVFMGHLNVTQKCIKTHKNHVYKHILKENRKNCY